MVKFHPAFSYRPAIPALPVWIFSRMYVLISEDFETAATRDCNHYLPPLNFNFPINAHRLFESEVYLHEVNFFVLFKICIYT